MLRCMSTWMATLVLAACGRTPGMDVIARRAPVEAERSQPGCLAAVSGSERVVHDVLRDQAALRKNSGDPSAWLRVGEDFVRVARNESEPAYYEHAADCARNALARSPADAAALRLLGLSLLNDHRFAEARTQAQTLLARHPEDAVSWGTLSDAELELGNLSGAIAAAQEMIDRKPNLPSYGRAAHLRWLQGDRAGAKRIYQQAIAAGREQRDPEPRAWMLVQAAWVFWHEGDYAGARAGFELALAAVPDYAPALEGRGRSLLALGDYAGAIATLSQALARHPLAETAWALGDAQSLSGHAAAADQAYARVERDAALFDPRTLSLFYSTKQRQPGRALSLARQAFAERQDVYTKDALAFALLRAGRGDEALRIARDVIALETPDARLLYHAGLIERENGAAERGEALIAQALRLNPRFDPVLTEHRPLPASRAL